MTVDVLSSDRNLSVAQQTLMAGCCALDKGNRRGTQLRTPSGQPWWRGRGGGGCGSPESSATVGLPTLEPAARVEPDMVVEERDTLAPESFITMAADFF